MDAIHVNWTKPYTDRTHLPYEIEDFELLTTILSALKWREKNGGIKMVTDTAGAEYYKKKGLDVIWNAVDVSLDNISVNSRVFWAAGKIFALSQAAAPTAILDTDFIVWEHIDESVLSDVSVIHYEDLYHDVYPPKEYFTMTDYAFDEAFDWTLKACNTAFAVFTDSRILKYYTEQAIDFMQKTREKDEYLKYMVFAEQRLLSMCAKKSGSSLSAFSDLSSLFSGGDARFTHTWGMKQQMRDDPALRRSFCKRCADRIIREYPYMKDIVGALCLM